MMMMMMMIIIIIIIIPTYQITLKIMVKIVTVPYPFVSH
jgi:hypothetical protein